MNRSAGFALILLTIAGLGGCYLFPLSPTDHGPSTDSYRVETEFIPDAKLARVDTNPTWELGRHVFVPGENRLLVISRITSWAEKDGVEVVPGTMRDRRIERAWITIPGGEQIGKKLSVEDLEDKYLTGFDIDNLDGKGAFIGPNLMKGYVTLKEVRDTVAVVDLEIEIRPTRPFGATDWSLMGEYQVPIAPDGLRAGKPRDSDILLEALRKRAPRASLQAIRDGLFNDSNAQDTAATPGPQDTAATPGPQDAAATPGGDATPTNPSAAATPAHADDVPKADTIAAPSLEGIARQASPNPGESPGKSEVPSDAARTIAGRWKTVAGNREHRFRFDAERKFEYTTQPVDNRDNAGPSSSQVGTYLVRRSGAHDWIVLFIDECRIDGKDRLDLYKGKPQIVTRVDWDGDAMVMTLELPLIGIAEPESSLKLKRE